jgi:hypothetical protein
MKKWLILLCFVLFIGCSNAPGSKIEVAPDPTFSWSAVTQACDGSTLTGVTYNVYVIPSPGPVPTITTTSEVPCGSVTVVDKSKVTALNTAPITTTTFNSTLGEGSYVAVVEAVSITGKQGGVSGSVAFTVILRPKAPINVNVN